MVAASHLCGCHQKLQVAYCQGGHLVRAAIGVMSHSIEEYSAVRLLQALPLRGSERYLSELGQFPPSNIRSAPPILDRASLRASDMSYRWPEGMRNQRVGLPRTGMGVGSEASFNPSTTSRADVTSFRSASASGTGPA